MENSHRFKLRWEYSASITAALFLAACSRVVESPQTNIILASSTPIPTEFVPPTLAPTHIIEYTPTPESDSPFLNKHLFVNPYTDIAEQAEKLKVTNPNAAKELAQVAAIPMADWFGDWNSNIQNDVAGELALAKSQNALPVHVLYNIFQRDCGGQSKGGASGAGDYLNWLGKYLQGVGNSEVAVVIEPDALGLTLSANCSLTEQQKQNRFDLLSQAASLLYQKPNIHSYLDVSLWIPPDIMAQKLKEMDILNHLSGIALNTSAYNSTASAVEYLNQLNGYLPQPMHAVIDTSRNGGQITSGKWCNPSGAALGQPPTTNTLHADVDAFLWLKPPQQSDGACKPGDLPAGQFDLKTITRLYQNSPYFK